MRNDVDHPGKNDFIYSANSFKTNGSVSAASGFYTTMLGQIGSGEYNATFEMSQIWKWIWVDSRNAKTVPHKVSQSTLSNAFERSKLIIQNESFAAKVLCKNELAVNKCSLIILPFVHPCCLEPMIFKGFSMRGNKGSIGPEIRRKFCREIKKNSDDVGSILKIVVCHDAGIWPVERAFLCFFPPHLFGRISSVQRQTAKEMTHSNLNSSTVQNVSVNSGRAMGKI